MIEELLSALAPDASSKLDKKLFDRIWRIYRREEGQNV